MGKSDTTIERKRTRENKNESKDTLTGKGGRFEGEGGRNREGHMVRKRANESERLNQGRRKR